MKQKLDKSYIGFFAGVFAPMLVFVAMYFFKDDYSNFQEYISYASYKYTAFKLLKICVFANLLLFLAGNLSQLFLFCRGLFFSTLIYIMFMGYIRFVT